MEHSIIHLATSKTDFGPVLKRVVVDVYPEDTVETLYNDRLKPAEHRAFIEVLKNPPTKQMFHCLK